METLRLKLEMVYRGLPVEEARAKFAELNPQMPPPPPPMVPVRRKVIPMKKA